MVRFRIISLYLYKDLDLRSSESRDHYHEDGNLVPSPRWGFCFSALRPKINHFRIQKKCYFLVKFVVSLITFVNDCHLLSFSFFTWPLPFYKGIVAAKKYNWHIIMEVNTLYISDVAAEKSNLICLPCLLFSGNRFMTNVY